MTALETGINAYIRQKQLDDGDHDQHDRADGFHVVHYLAYLVLAREHSKRQEGSRNAEQQAAGSRAQNYEVF